MNQGGQRKHGWDDFIQKSVQLDGLADADADLIGQDQVSSFPRRHTAYKMKSS